MFEAVLFATLCLRLQDPTDTEAASKIAAASPAHKGGVTTIAFRRDGKVFATGGWDNTVKVWSSEGTLLRTLKGFREHVTGVSFSADGKYLATSAGDGKLRIFDGGSARLLRTVAGGTSYLSGVVFGMGDTLFTSGYDNKVKAWSASSGKLVRQFSLPSDGYAVEISKDGSLVFGGGPGGVSVFESKTGKRVAKYATGEASVLSMAANSNTGNIIFVGGPMGVMQFDAKSNQAKSLEMQLSGYPVEVAYEAKGNMFGVTTTTGQVVVRSTESSEQTVFEGHREYVQALGFSPDGKWLVSGDSKGRLAVWDLTASKFHRVCAQN